MALSIVSHTDSISIHINNIEIPIWKIEKWSSFYEQFKPIPIDTLVDCKLTEWPDSPHIIRLTSTNDANITRAQLQISNFDENGGAYFRKIPYIENHWEWNPREQVGIFHFELKYQIESRHFKFRIPVYVQPRKIDLAVFNCMMNDLRRRHISIYQRCAPEIWNARNRRIEICSFEEQFQKLKTNFSQFEAVVRRIADNPHKKVTKEYQTVDFHQLAEIDANIISHIAALKGGITRPDNPGIARNLQDMMKGHLPDKAQSPHTVINYDTPENRLVNKYLEIIGQTLSILKSHKANEILDHEEHFICEKYARRINTLKRLPFLYEVSSADSIVSDSIVFQKDCNYRAFYGLGQEILMTPFFDASKIFHMPIKKLNLIYELWCVIAIYEGLCERISGNWNINDEGVFKKARFGFLIDLNENTRNKRIFTAEKSDTRIEMWYQKEYCAYYKNRIPDITFEIWENGSLNRILIFDPKYRQKLDYGEDNTEGALPKMHLYKDAIVFDGKRLVKEAYILYPGDNENSGLQSQNKIFKAFGCDNDVIGAIAFRPDLSSRNMDNQLDFIFNRIFNENNDSLVQDTELK
jgi:hypothetical protein